LDNFKGALDHQRPGADQVRQPAALLGVQAIVLRNRSTCAAIPASFAINSAERWAKFLSTRLQPQPPDPALPLDRIQETSSRLSMDPPATGVAAIATDRQL